MKKLGLTIAALFLGAACYAQTVRAELLFTVFHDQGWLKLQPFCLQVNTGPHVTSAEAKPGDWIIVSAATSPRANDTGYFTVTAVNSPSGCELPETGRKVRFAAGDPGRDIRFDFQIPENCGPSLQLMVDVYPEEQP